MNVRRRHGGHDDEEEDEAKMACALSLQNRPFVALSFWHFLVHGHLRDTTGTFAWACSKEARQRKRMVVVKAEIQMKNLKLYMENQTIIEENEKLRKQAMLLHKENQALLSQLQKKLSEQTNNTNNN
ncbi:hypothetical protein V8G54_022096 [Vigna mungo]|uniref:Protein LITTLE ZIPPER 3 n=1 Tax=Vigna mungo TaxID=3915 RepID=A0AAQ3NFG1_VIGMU